MRDTDRMTGAPAAIADIVEILENEADPQAREAMSEQYGIHAEDSYGVPMRRLLQIAKATGTDHAMASDLWAQGSYEARTIAAMIDDPADVSTDQMQQWCDEFDNWAIVDTACFRLFDRTAHAWPMVDRWVDDDRLFVRRAGFALVWALALHDPETPDQHFVRALGHARHHSSDPRPLVGKSITMALRAIATKRPSLRDDVVAVAQQCSDDDDPAARRVGRPILRAFAVSAEQASPRSEPPSGHG